MKKLTNSSEEAKKDSGQKLYTSPNGLFACNCVMLGSMPDYELAEKPYARMPRMRGKLSKGAASMLEKMCRVHPTHLATHEFLMSITGRSHNTVYSYLKELKAVNAVISYKLINRQAMRYISQAYRPITYLVAYKKAKVKNVNRKVRKDFIKNRRICHTRDEIAVTDAAAYIAKETYTTGIPKPDIAENDPARIRRVQFNTAKRKVTKTAREVLAENAELVNLPLKGYIYTHVTHEYEEKLASLSSASSPGSSAEMLLPPKYRIYTQDICRALCATYYRKTVEVLMEAASDGHLYNSRNLPGPLSRSINYRMHWDRKGGQNGLTYAKALQIRALVEHGYIEKRQLEDLVKDYKFILSSPKCAEFLKRIVTDIAHQHAGAFGQQRHNHPINSRLYGLDQCIALVNSFLTTNEVFQDKLRKRSDSLEYNYYALLEAVRITGRYDLIEGFHTRPTHTDYMALDIGSRHWLARKCANNWEDFEDFYGTTLDDSIVVLWKQEQSKAGQALQRIGLKFSLLDAEVAKVGKDFYDMDELADKVLPYLRPLNNER